MLTERKSKRLQASIAIPVALALLVQHDVLIFYSLFLCLLLWPLVLVAVVGAWLLALEALVAKLRRKPASHLWTALLLALCLGPAFPWVNRPFDWIAAAHKLLRNEAEYTELIREVESRPVEDGVYVRDHMLHVELGPPRRYYFCWGGLADNTIGVIHDASRTLGLDDVDVFGGDLIDVTHLWGPWYLAAFT